MKSNEDKVVDAIIEMTKKPQAGIFEVLEICLRHFGDNVSKVELSKKEKI